MPDIDRRPAALALKTMLLIFSTPTALGVVPLPGSLQATPGIYGQTAAAGIWFGCLISIGGILWGLKFDHLNGLVIEQTGLVFIPVGCALYSIALLGVERPSQALLAFAMSVGVAAFAVVQYLSIRRYRNKRLGGGHGRTG